MKISFFVHSVVPHSIVLAVIGPWFAFFLLLNLLLFFFFQNTHGNIYLILRTKTKDMLSNSSKDITLSYNE